MRSPQTRKSAQGAPAWALVVCAVIIVVLAAVWAQGVGGAPAAAAAVTVQAEAPAVFLRSSNW